jgi:hypothetical protein
MPRVLKCGMTFCGESFAATLTLPDEYFDGEGKPIRHKLNSRLSAHPSIVYGDHSEPVLAPSQPTQTETR